MTAPRLSDVLGVLDALYDPRWADAWDRVGLVCGDPEASVERILFAIDPTEAVVDQAVEYGADLLVVHHPLLLTPVSSVAATTPKGRVVHRLLGNGVALLTAHTNADTPAYGVNDSLARAVGIVDPRVLLPTDDTALDKLVTFVPHDAADRVRDAITSAGAGHIGDYDSCTFTSVGEGRFRALDGANPTIGSVGELEVVPESRVESVYPRARRGEVLAAMVAAHPYEEPAYDVYELGAGRVEATRGHGRIGSLETPTTLREFAAHVATALPGTAHGVRVAGDPDREVRTVAVGAGAGDSLLDLVAGSGADVFLTSDLRHHRAGEFLELRGPALVDVAHWAAEWTWLPVAEGRVVAGLAERGYTVDTRVSTLVTDPWTFRAGA
ncbi:MAG TPA: Nif3-like dinuclear metal center hexameric protein [Nocardioidaceae bacterium]|nr:Nif3-like dinuclear metal center hexameric protein [Nocardioidaceae bacterium]